MDTGNIRRLILATVLTIMAAGVSMAATVRQQTIAPGGPPAPQIQHHDGIAYVSGGVSEGERGYLEGLKKAFDLKVVTAIQDGEYLSGMQVHIQDARGKTILETTAGGPWLFAKLMPGTYKVRIAGFGHSHEKTVKIAANHLAQLDFYWPNRDRRKMPAQ